MKTAKSAKPPEKPKVVKPLPGPYKVVFLHGHRFVTTPDGCQEIAKIAAYKNAELSAAHARLLAAAPSLVDELRSILTEIEEKDGYDRDEKGRELRAKLRKKSIRKVLATLDPE